MDQNPQLSLLVSSKIISLSGKNYEGFLRNKKYADFVVKAIQGFFSNRKKVRHFKLLYNYSYLKPASVNTHIYVDDHPSLLFIAELAKT